jgi:hypothetical protein
MQSMWDRIFDSPVPINKLARIVTSSAPWWAQPVEKYEPGVTVDKKKKSIICDYVSIMKPPPDGLLDYRGRRSRYHIICGFAYRRTDTSPIGINNDKSKNKRKNNWFSNSPIYDRGAIRSDNKMRKTEGVSVWYYLRADGFVGTVTSQSLRKKMSNLDKAYILDVNLGYASMDMSSEWKALCEIPITLTPAVSNNKTIVDAVVGRQGRSSTH